MNTSFAAKLGQHRAKDLSRYATALEGVRPPENLVHLHAVIRAEFDDSINLEVKIDLVPTGGSPKPSRGWKYWFQDGVFLIGTFALGFALVWIIAHAVGN